MARYRLSYRDRYGKTHLTPTFATFGQAMQFKETLRLFDAIGVQAHTIAEE